MKEREEKRSFKRRANNLFGTVKETKLLSSLYLCLYGTGS